MKKISPEIDLEILEGLAAGYSNKQLAELYKVSPSYVSKLKTGKKVPYIHVANPTLIKDEFFEVYNTNLTEVLAYLECKDLFVNKKDIKCDTAELEIKAEQFALPTRLASSIQTISESYS